MKVRITIEVERDGSPITDMDLGRAVGGTLHVIDTEDVGLNPFLVARGGDDLRWSYMVEKVKQ